MICATQAAVGQSVNSSIHPPRVAQPTHRLRGYRHRRGFYLYRDELGRLARTALGNRSSHLSTLAGDVVPGFVQASHLHPG
jgi:hypothetical protein